MDEIQDPPSQQSFDDTPDRQSFDTIAGLLHDGVGAQQESLRVEPPIEADMDTLLAAVRGEASRFEGKTRGLIITTIVSGSIMLIDLILLLLTRSPILIPFICLLLPAGPLFAGSVIFLILHSGSTQKTVRKNAGLLGNVRAVGPLCEALELGPKMRRFAAPALIHLLPQLRASDAGLLSPAQRACLCRVLNGAHYGQDLKLSLSILKAFEQVGGDMAIPTVERLAAKPLTKGTHKRGIDEVVEAARECLPYLQQSAMQMRVGRQLLRASSQADLVSGDLLRPSGEHRESTPEHLLRASLSQEMDQQA